MRPKRMRLLLRLGCRCWVGWAGIGRAGCANVRAFACALGWVEMVYVFMYVCQGTGDVWYE